MSTINTPKASHAFNGAAKTHGFDFKIEGAHTPYLELWLQPGKAFIGESGTMMMKSGDVEMKPVLGDGSDAGMLGKAWSAVRRKIGGESILLNGYENTSESQTRILTLAAPIQGEITAIDLGDHGGEIVAQRGSFMAAPRGDVQLGFGMKLNGFGLLGGEGVVMQKIKGDDWVFLNAGGSFNTIELAAGESIEIDTGCLVAASKSVTLSSGLSGGISTMLFGGEGAFLAKAMGPGTVWTQSMPFQRQVQLMQQNMKFPSPKR